MDNMIDINTIVKNAKSVCKRDGYPQIVYAYEDGELAFTRLYNGLKLSDIKEIIGVVDGGWRQSGYVTYYIDDKNDIEQIIKSYKVDTPCSLLCQLLGVFTLSNKFEA